MSRWRLIDLEQTDGFDALGILSALSESLGKRMEDNTLVLSRSKTFLYLGPQVDPDTYDENYCLENNILLLKSDFKGGAVLYDGNQVFFIIAIREDHPLSDIPFNIAAKPILSAFRKLGVNAYPRSGRNDVLINGRKITGIAFVVTDYNVKFITGMINLKFNFALAKSVLKISDRDFKEKGVKVLDEWITSLRRETNREYTFREVKNAIKFGLEDIFKIDFYDGEFTEYENLIIEKTIIELGFGEVHSLPNKRKPKSGKGGCSGCS